MDTPQSSGVGDRALVSRSGRMAAGLGLFVGGLIIGALAGWYFTRVPQAVPEPSPSPMASASPSPTVSTVAFRTVQEPAAGVEGQYMVIIDGKDAGIVKGYPVTTGPALIEAGNGWAIVEVPPDGLGGYIVFGVHYDSWFVNEGGTVVRLAGAGNKLGFSADGRLAAYFTRDETRYSLVLFDLAQARIVRISTAIVIPEGINAQAGLPTFSPDGTKIAYVLWYGPDNEHGEIYVGNTADLASFTKVGDTTVLPSELFWRPDGTVGWR